MKTVTTIITLLALLLSNIINAQSDSSMTKKVIIDNKKIKVTLKSDSKNKDDYSVIVTEKSMDSSGTKTIEKEEILFQSDDNCKKKENKRNPTNWCSIDFGFSLLEYKGTLDMPEEYKALDLDNGKGCEFNLRLYEQSLGIIRDKLFLVYGIGFDWNNYRFRNDIMLLKDSVQLSYRNTGINYKKNKLTSCYITAPLMIKANLFRDKDGEAFHISAGAQFGYLINSHIKQKVKNEGDQKLKVDGDFNLVDFRIGYAAYVGYKGINFYVKYFPDGAFKSGRGPEVNTLSMGLAFGDFN